MGSEMCIRDRILIEENAPNVMYSIDESILPPNTEIAWVVTGGTIDGDDDLASITVTWGPAGPGNVSVWLSNGSCPEIGADLPVTIYPCPSVPTITGPILIEENAPNVMYSIDESILPPNTELAWVVTGGTIDGDDDLASITVTWGPAGPGNVSVWLSNGSCPEIGADLPVTIYPCLLYTSPSPRDLSTSRMPSSA